MAQDGAAAPAAAEQKEDSYEAVGEDALKMLDQVLVILKGIKDEETANAAVVQFKLMEQAGKGLAKRAEALGKPTEEQKKALEEKFMPKMKAFQQGMMAEFMRILSDPELLDSLTPLMEELEKSMPDMKGAL